MFVCFAGSGAHARPFDFALFTSAANLQKTRNVTQINLNEATPPKKKQFCIIHLQCGRFIYLKGNLWERRRGRNSFTDAALVLNMSPRRLRLSQIWSFELLFCKCSEDSVENALKMLFYTGSIKSLNIKPKPNFHLQESDIDVLIDHLSLRSEQITEFNFEI